MTAELDIFTPSATTLLRARTDDPVTISCGATLEYGTTSSLGSSLTAGQSLTVTADTYVRSPGAVLLRRYAEWDIEEHDLQESPGEVSFNVKEFEAKGDGVADDSTAIQAAVTAASVTGGLVFFPPGSYLIGTRINVTNSNVTIRGVGASSVIKIGNGSSQLSAIKFAGSAGGTADLASNAADGDQSVELESGGVAALSLVEGDYISVEESDGAPRMTTRIRTIASEVLTLTDAIPAAMTTANGARVQKLSMLEGVGVHDLHIDGSGNTHNNSTGIEANFCANSSFTGISGDGLSAGAVTAQYGHFNHFADFVADGSTSTIHAALWLLNQTGFSAHGWRASRCAFGIELLNSHYGQFLGAKVSSGGTRGFKSTGCTHNNHVGINVSEVDATGIVLNAGTSFNVYTNCVTNGVAQATSGEGGLWLNGEANNNNLFVGCSFTNSPNADIVLQTGTDTGNVFVGCQYEAVFDADGRTRFLASPPTAIPSTASAATVTLPTHSEVHTITGTTTITSLTASWAGRRVTLTFADVLTFTDGSNLKLAGDFTTSADDTISLLSDGTNWIETGRSAN